MNLASKLKETSVSVIPVMAIVLFLGFSLAPLNKLLLIRFVISGILLIIGLTIFLTGVSLGIEPMGERTGSQLTSKRNLPLLLSVSFLIGFIVTIAEPDIQVFVLQVKSMFSFVNKAVFTIVIAAGIGLFVMLGLLRSVLNISIKITLAAFYLILFILVFIAPSSFTGIAFDSGGATTGPMTVPFIMALGLGVSAVSGSSKSSFGLTGVASIGPVMAVLIYALVISTNPLTANATAAAVNGLPSVSTASAIFSPFATAAVSSIKEVLFSILPLLALFIVFQFTLLKMTGRQVIRILIGFAYSLTGLFIFLTGVNGGFTQTGAALGSVLGQKAAHSSLYFIVLLITGLILGAIIVCAEPAVWVLSEQVENITGGTIKRRVLLIFLSCGTAIAIGIAMIRSIYSFNLKYILIPGYALAFILMIFSPEIFTGIAFDSGGVASGPLTSTFVLSFTIGAASAAAQANGQSSSTDSFGVIALVAMMPLIAIQLMGIIYKIKQSKNKEASK